MDAESGQMQTVAWTIELVSDGKHFTERGRGNGNMRKATVIQIVAAVIGLAVLCAIVTLGVAFISTDGNYMWSAVYSNLVAFVVTAAMWTGDIWGRPGSKSMRPESWGEWLGTFAGSLVFTLLFLLMDCGGRLPIFHPDFVCNGHPGISVVFTLGAILTTVVALPSAVRAWVLEKYGDASR